MPACLVSNIENSLCFHTLSTWASSPHNLRALTLVKKHNIVSRVFKPFNNRITFHVWRKIHNEKFECKQTLSPFISIPFGEIKTRVSCVPRNSHLYFAPLILMPVKLENFSAYTHRPFEIVSKKLLFTICMVFSTKCKLHIFLLFHILFTSNKSITGRFPSLTWAPQVIPRDATI